MPRATRATLWTLVLALTLSRGHAAWMIFSAKDICVRLQTKGEMTIGRSNRSFPIPDPDDDPSRLVIKMRSLEFQAKRGNTIDRVSWEDEKSTAFHLDAWEADELEGVQAQGRRMWDSVPQTGIRFTLRAYLFAQASVITSLGDMRVDKGDVKVELEIDKFQCVDCDDYQFVQIEASVTGSGPVFITDKKAFGKKLQFGGRASMWLPNKIFTADDAKTKVDVETAPGRADSVVFTVRLSLLPARKTVYSILLKPARPTPLVASDTRALSNDATRRRLSLGGAEPTQAVGCFSVVFCLVAAMVLFCE